MKGNRFIEGLNYDLSDPLRVEAELLRTSFSKTYKEDGVIRWKANRQVPPQQVLDFWKHLGFRFNMRLSVAARDREEKASLRQYLLAKRMQPRQFVSDEGRGRVKEMRLGS